MTPELVIFVIFQIKTTWITLYHTKQKLLSETPSSVVFVKKNLSFFTLDWDGTCTPGVWRMMVSATEGCGFSAYNQFFSMASMINAHIIQFTYPKNSDFPFKKWLFLRTQNGPCNTGKKPSNWRVLRDS